MNDLYSKIIQIPHLNLTPYLPKVPLEDMVKDLSQFKDDDFFSYKTIFISQQLV